MRISEVIKELQEIYDEHGDLPCNAYLFKEWSRVRHVHIVSVNPETQGEVKEVFIEGDKYSEL